jgi:hypothetical protein
VTTILLSPTRLCRTLKISQLSFPFLYKMQCKPLVFIRNGNAAAGWCLRNCCIYHRTICEWNCWIELGTGDMGEIVEDPFLERVHFPPRFERSFLNTNRKTEHYLTMESVGLKKVFCHTHFDTITKLQMNPPLKVNLSPIHSSLMIGSKGASQGNSDSSKTVTIAIIHHRE